MKLDKIFDSAETLDSHRRFEHSESDRSKLLHVPKAFWLLLVARLTNLYFI
jgi:hypothetical protein